jgi:hypothetical protein
MSPEMVPMIVRILAAAALSACLFSAAACGTTSAPAASRSAPAATHDHGRVVADLPIAFAPRPVFLETEIIRVTVNVGQRFSIKVGTSDGPVYWDQVGSPPDPRLVKVLGNFNDGHCPPDLVGCRVPYFHTLLALAAGTTTMTWRYHNLACQVHQMSASKVVARCARLRTVIFDIVIR